MRQALIKPAASTVKSITSPVGGWNTKSEIADMDARDAILLDNLFPRSADVQLRKGSADHATGITGTVETLMSYSFGATKKMFAAAGTNVYDATAGGAVGVAVVSTTVNARWSYVNFGTSGGQFLVMANGAVHPWNYNGTVWAQTPAITGVTAANLIHVHQFKYRLYFIEANTLKAWYLPTASIGGAAAALDFSQLTRLGGQLMAMGTLSIDGGAGIDDHAVWITSEGEVIVFKGTDPAVANSWAHVGTFRIGRPIGRNCMLKYGGDLIIITVDGFVPLAKVVVGERNRSSAISEKIYDAVVSAALEYKSNFGWQAILFPNQNMLLFNIPVRQGVESHQYVMNTHTGAWCRFKGWNTSCFELHNDELYFGGTSKVLKAWVNQSDSGVSVDAEVRQASNYFGERGILKHFQLVRPLYQTDGKLGLIIDMNVDFEDVSPTSYPTFQGTSGSPWDTSPWDTSPWGSTLSIRKEWQSVTGLGYCGSIRMKVSSNLPQFFWASTDIMYKRGGYL